MYSKSEAAEIRKNFWMAFDTYSRKHLGPKESGFCIILVLKTL